MSTGPASPKPSFWSKLLFRRGGARCGFARDYHYGRALERAPVECVCWWVPPETQASVAVLREATALPFETLQAMGARGSAWVGQDFGWDRAAADMKAAYEQVMERKEAL